MPAGAATRTGIWSTSRPSSAAPASCGRAAGQDDPGRQHARRPRRASRCASSSNVSRMRASMIWHTSSRLTVRPASSPSTETRDLLVVGSIAAQVARPVADLELLGDLEARLEPDRDVVGHVVAADRQDARVERRAVGEQGEVDRAGADVGDRDAQLLLGLGQRRPRPTRASRRRARRS